MFILLVGTAPPLGPLVELLFGPPPQACNSVINAANPRIPKLFVCMPALSEVVQRLDSRANYSGRGSKQTPRSEYRMPIPPEAVFTTG
jgi:hypothetical protein